MKLKISDILHCASIALLESIHHFEQTSFLSLLAPAEKEREREGEGSNIVHNAVYYSTGHIQPSLKMCFLSLTLRGGNR